MKEIFLTAKLTGREERGEGWRGGGERYTV
jgi:hypothetical protein